MTSSPPVASERFDRIDVLRGIAIVVVVMHHFMLAFTAAGVRPELVPALGDWNRWFFLPHRLGYLGVQLFFVISGFCIHNSYLGWRRKTQEPTVRAFLLNYFNRRFWRIYPPYVVALLIAFGIAYWPHFDARALRHLAFNASLANTLSEQFFYNINPAFWSIAVEWQLYMAYPIVLWLSRRIGPWGAMGAAAATAMLWRFALPTVTTNWALLHLPFLWWFEWCLGFLIADLLARGRTAIPRSTLATTLLIPAALLALVDGTVPVLTWSLPPLAFAALLQAVCASRRPLTSLERLIGSVGLSSYSLYLLHNPFIWGAQALFRSFAPSTPAWVFWIPLFALSFAVMQAASWAMFRLVEAPSIAIGKTVERSFLPRFLKPAA